MIGGLITRLRASTAAAALAAGLAALPPLGQQRALSSRPGSGIVKRGGGRSPRRDGARQAAAQAKRDRKNAKRREDWHRCWLGNGATWKGRYWPVVGVNHGK